jgi:hypothetical protein
MCYLLSVKSASITSSPLAVFLVDPDDPVAVPEAGPAPGWLG